MLRGREKGRLSQTYCQSCGEKPGETGNVLMVLDQVSGPAASRGVGCLKSFFGRAEVLLRMLHDVEKRVRERGSFRDKAGEDVGERKRVER